MGWVKVVSVSTVKFVLPATARVVVPTAKKPPKLRDPPATAESNVTSPVTVRLLAISMLVASDRKVAPPMLIAPTPRGPERMPSAFALSTVLAPNWTTPAVMTAPPVKSLALPMTL